MRYGPVQRDNRQSNMYQLSNEVIKFIEKTMKNREVNLAAGRESFADVKS